MKTTDGRFDQLPAPVASEGALMLYDPVVPRWSDFDRQIFQSLVPADHSVKKSLGRDSLERLP